MYRFYPVFLLALLLIACDFSKDSEAGTELKYSIESAQMALILADRISEGKPVTDADWESLFSSEGYQYYFCAFDREDGEPLLREAFSLAFDPERIEARDSLLAAPVQMSPSARLNFVLRNLVDLRENREKLDAFIKQSDFDEMLMEANKLAKEWLPASAATDAELHEVHFVLMESNSYVTDCGLMVDINNARQMGENGLSRMIGHEYHHNYRNLNTDFGSHFLMKLFSDLQAKGIADLIDKEPPPVESMGNFPPEIVAIYNRVFADTPAHLARLDSLAGSHFTWEMDEAAFEKSLQGFLPDGGHANGYYMALLIEQAGLRQSLIETFDNPVAFAKLYNRAAKQKEGEYVLSDELIWYLEDLLEDHRGVATEDEETHTITFEVEVPEPGDALHITGSGTQLGQWDGVGQAMETSSDRLRTITLELTSPAEFKFTRGSWASEGIWENKRQNRNLELRFDSDTTVRYAITKWIDREMPEESREPLYEVTFTLNVPNASDEVYITGDGSSLGYWNPGLVKMNRVRPAQRSISLKVHSPVEYKFTRGNWDTEGIWHGKVYNRNLRLETDRDTTVAHTITGWLDTEQ